MARGEINMAAVMLNLHDRGNRKDYYIAQPIKGVWRRSYSQLVGGPGVRQPRCNA